MERVVGRLEGSCCGAVAFVLPPRVVWSLVATGCNCGFWFATSFAVVLAAEVASPSVGFSRSVGMPLCPFLEAAVFALTFVEQHIFSKCQIRRGSCANNFSHELSSEPWPAARKKAVNSLNNLSSLRSTSKPARLYQRVSKNLSRAGAYISL